MRELLRRRTGRVLAVAGVSILALVAGCGGDDVSGVVQKDAGIPCVQPSDVPTAQGKPPAPSIPPAPPTGQLVSQDLQPGSGEAAAPGQQVTVQYFVLSCGTGKQIFSTWDATASADPSAPAPTDPTGPATFVLMAPEALPGVVQGITGMTVGGIREVLVPAGLAMGAAGGQLPGGGTVVANDTLVYVVQLDAVAPAPTTTAPPPTTAPAPAPAPGSSTPPATDAAPPATDSTPTTTPATAAPDSTTGSSPSAPAP